MKILLMAGAIALAVSMPAFAEDTTDHAAHHPPAATTPAEQPAAPSPAGTASCPMMKDGKPMGSSNGAMMQGGMMQGGAPQSGMMDKSHMTQCPMMQTPSGATNNLTPPTPPSPDASGHADHHPDKP